jgi:hypothetical protein
VVPPPMQTQIQRMGGMSSAVIGGFCKHSPVVHELVAKFADMTAKDTAKEQHGRVAAQRGHSTPEAPHTTAAGHRGMARLPRKQNRAPALRGTQHRIRTHASPPPPGLGREVESRETQSPEHSRKPLGRRE